MYKIMPFIVYLLPQYTVVMIWVGNSITLLVVVVWTRWRGCWLEELLSTGGTVLDGPLFI